MLPDRPTRVTAADVGRIIGTVAPSVQTFHLRSTKLWLVDQREPFAEVDLMRNGRLVGLRFSVHCTPAWAGIITAALAREAPALVVAPEGFIQDDSGRVLYAAEAEAYWLHHRRITPLLTARFTPPPH